MKDLRSLTYCADGERVLVRAVNPPPLDPNVKHPLSEICKERGHIPGWANKYCARCGALYTEENDGKT